jgi:TRAP-type mannitol/chloroaromatic compound transport system permease small subunit
MTPNLAKKMERGCRVIDTVNEWTGRAVSWLTLSMVLVTFLVVVLRYAFNMGWIAMQESIIYMHAVVFLMGGAYTLKHEGHVRVDIFYRTMPPRRQALVNLFGTLFLLLPTFGFILWVSWSYVAESWIVLEGSREAGGIAGVYLLKSVILIMTVTMLLQGVAELLRNMLILADPTQRES